MYFLISHFPAGILCFLFVVASILISCTGLFLLKRVVSYETLRANHEVTGIIFGSISLIYTLVLAFVIIAVWNDYEELNSTIEQEADKLSAILVRTEELPDSLAKPIQNAIREYSQLVVKNEWQTESNKRISNTYLQRLRQTLYKFHPSKESEQKILSVIDEDLSDAVDLRRELLNHDHSHVPGLVWMILIAGTIITIICSYLFFVEPKQLHYLFIALLTCMIAMSLFLVYMLDHPFEGSTHVSSTPLEQLYSH